MKIKYYDIGVNLFCRQFRDPEKIIIDSAKEGVACILTGTDMKENRLVNEFVSTHEAYATAGIHPHNADDARKEDFEVIEGLIRNNTRIVAVGECGLDFDRMFSTKENQIRCLEKHIVLAEKLGKPMFLHERSADAEFIKRFKNREEICRKSVVHCFTGNERVLEKYLEMGFNIGITGWICDDRRSTELRRAVKILPLDRVLVETDAPYLTPKNVPGLDRTNVPGNVRYVVRELAKYMEKSEDELTVRAKENTEKLFGLKRE